MYGTYQIISAAPDDVLDGRGVLKGLVGILLEGLPPLGPLSAENPPNTTEWGTPIQAQASIATGSS